MGRNYPEGTPAPGITGIRSHKGQKVGPWNASFIANSSWLRGGLRPKPIPELEEWPLSNSAAELRDVPQISLPIPIA